MQWLIIMTPLEWTTSGTGIFTPSDDVLVVDYTPSSQDIANRSELF